MAGARFWFCSVVENGTDMRFTSRLCEPDLFASFFETLGAFAAQ